MNIKQHEIADYELVFTFNEVQLIMNAEIKYMKL